jgi:hypothetical protein
MMWRPMPEDCLAPPQAMLLVLSGDRLCAVIDPGTPPGDRQDLAMPPRKGLLFGAAHGGRHCQPAINAVGTTRRIPGLCTLKQLRLGRLRPSRSRTPELAFPTHDPNAELIYRAPGAFGGIPRSSSSPMRGNLLGDQETREPRGNPSVARVVSLGGERGQCNPS